MSLIIPKNELNEFSLPRVCVATGQPGPVTFQKVQFQFIPKWIAALALFPLLYLICFMLLRKTANGTLPFSEQGWNDVKAARRNVAFAVLGLIGACFLGGFLAANTRGDTGGLLLLGLIIVGVVAIVVTSLQIRKVFPFATFIDDRAVTLTFPSPEAERLFEQHLNAGSRSRAA